MVPILYESTETAFTSNGIGRLVDCISCLVTEERNGIFEVEFQYPVTGKRYSEITEDRIISVSHDDTQTRQPFIIYRRSAPIDGIVTFNAHHVSYALAHSILQPFTATSVAQAFSLMASKSITPCGFTFWTDKISSGNFAVTVPISIKEILGGVQGSILDVYGGGEYEWDKYTVKLYQNRGTNSGVTVRYGKNLTDLTQERDTSGMYNAVIPYWTNGEQTVTLGTEIVKMSGVTDPVAVPLDMSSDFQDAPTTTQLKNSAQSKLNNSDAWNPDQTITIDFVQLWQTDEYKDVAVLQRVKLCDTVTVIHPALGLTAQAKVVKVVYNALLDKYDSMELGNAKTSFADTIAKSIESSIVKNVPSVGMMQAAIDHATQLITGGLGGYVVYTLNADGEPQEILIMDTDDIQTAVNVIRINKNGIGFSTTGYNGPFTSAWTIDGHFNADFITAGTLSANFIKGGTLKMGGSGNGNGVIEVYNSSNVLIGKIDNSGADIAGKLTAVITGVNVFGTTVGARAAFETTVPANTLTAPFYKYLTSGSPRAFRTITDFQPGYVISAFRGNNQNSPDVKLYFAPDEVYRRGITLLFEQIYGTSTSVPTKTTNPEFAYKNEDYGTSALYIHGGLTYKDRPIGVSDTENDTFFTAKNDYLYWGHYSGGTGGYPSGNNNNGGFSWSESSYNDEDDEHIRSTDLDRVVFKISPVVIVMGKVGTSNGSMSSPSVYITSSVQKVNNQQIAFDSNSSRRYKHDIANLEDEGLDPHKLYNLIVHQFIYNSDVKLQYPDMEGNLIPGLIAEEVAEIYPSAVIHDRETGEIESWDERRILPGMLALVQEQKKQIDDLTARIEKLEAYMQGQKNER